MSGHIINSILFLLSFLALYSCDDDDSIVHDSDPLEEFYGEPFDKMPALKDVVMYEANERVFAANSSFGAITGRLDQIRSLGVNVLWLMPVTKQGQENAFGSPYCVKDYQSTNPEYGSLDDLRTLVKEAHNREMAVIIDWVANHTAWDNVWLDEHPEWYTRDADGNPMAPAGTNWSDVVDLNYNNHEMRAEMIEMMKFWVREANIDGFRCDAADWVPIDFWREAIYELRYMQEDRTILMLAEGTEPKNLQAGFDMDYGWNFCDVLEGVFNDTKTIASLYQSHLDEYEVIPDGKQKLRHNTNHDRANEYSPVTKYQNAQGALASFVISSTMGGVPLIYSSQEVAYANTVDFFNYVPVNWDENESIHSEYQNIMSAYQTYDVFRNGSLEFFGDKDVVCFSHTLDQQEALVVVNVRNQALSFTVPQKFIGSDWHDMLTNNSVHIAESINLDPFQYELLINE
ncbi:alpha-amylase family glycosyl hydrolase [Geofilum sp. OHC36d9]|uniref:alpha-amylase family glycosyl hydrolase n=1 Tax=Geofilum sp. OHC36d9 TaxID=3458413 RepID=UPI004034BA38